ncbi:ATP-binding cassette domain-containing protein [Candidatus Latescibacterota bacterium]
MMVFPLYNISGLKHGYNDRFLLDIPRLRIEQGTSLGLFGPNGSGKSTLLKILAFLEPNTEGIIRYNGTTVTRSDAASHREVTMLLQEPYLLKRTVFENIAYGLRVRGEREHLTRRVNEVLEDVGLSPEVFAGRDWFKLSGGEAKRVALAARLAFTPQVLILDEPTANVDRQSASFIKQAIDTARLKYHTSLIIASHDIIWLNGVTDEVIKLYEGRIIESGTDNIISGPWHPDRDGLWKKELPDGQTISATQPPDTRAKAVLNPSNIMISQKRPEGVSAQNCLKGTITSMAVEKESGAIRIDVAVSGIPFICSVTHHAAETLKLLPGKEVWVVFKASSLHWQ